MYSHAAACEYYWFRDVEAPRLGMVSIEEFITHQYPAQYLAAILLQIKVPHRLFHITGIFGRGYDLLVDSTAAQAISMFNANPEGYSGMTLEEFVTRMCGGDE